MGRLRPSVLLAGALFLGAAALRIAGARNDLWLDEIWALGVAQDLASPLDVFTGLHHEINHHLSTLWLWAMGMRGNWIGYRVPSLVAGIATVAVAGWIGRRRSDAAMLCTLAVVGASFPLVLYASEARGYAGCVLMAFVGFAFLERHLETGSARAAVGYACAAILGMLSHPIFVSVIAAGLVWSVQWLVVGRASLRTRAARVALAQLPPLLALATLYWVDLRHIAVGGGTEAPSRFLPFGEALAWALGAPMEPRIQVIMCVVAIAVFAAGLWVIARERCDARIFYAGVIGFPLLLAFARDSDVLYPRHFLLSIAFLLLLLGRVLAWLFEAGGWRRSLAAAALALFLAANGAHVAALLRHGRGMPSELLRYLADRTATPSIVVGSDHDFRIGGVLGFIAEWSEVGDRLDYRMQDAWPPEGPEWILTHAEPYAPPSPPDEIRGGADHLYLLTATFPSAPLSGMHWFVYRKAEPALRHRGDAR